MLSKGCPRCLDHSRRHRHEPVDHLFIERPGVDAHAVMSKSALMQVRVDDLMPQGLSL